MSILLLWDESGRPITNGREFSIWEGKAFSLSAYYNHERGGSISVISDSSNQFIGMPSVFNSINSLDRSTFTLRSKDNNIADGDRLVNIIVSNERSGSAVQFSLLIMDDEFGRNQSGASSSTTRLANSSSPSGQSIVGDGNTVINGNGNTVNINKTINKNTNNGTINNNIFNFNIGTISVDMRNAMQGDSSKSDIVTGTTGDDVIASGVGADKLTGNGGKDTFVISELSELGKKGANTITDFDPDSGDKIVIDPNEFSGQKFATASNRREFKQLQKTDADFIYGSFNGRLSYDSNGERKGLGSSGGLLAILENNPNLSKENLGLLG
jgi:Ca2+-binding RTX toxin-like protein